MRLGTWKFPFMVRIEVAAGCYNINVALLSALSQIVYSDKYEDLDPRDARISIEMHVLDIQRSFQFNSKTMESKLLTRICLRHPEFN